MRRTCNRCKIPRDLEDFDKDRRNPSGRTGTCKLCRRTRAAAYYHTVIKSDPNKLATLRSRQAKFCRSDKGKAADRRYLATARGRTTRNEATKRYHRRYPLKTKARSRVSAEVRAGRLPPASSCLCACGRPATQYHHHHGYARKHWLDVIPVCNDCHQVSNLQAREAVQARGSRRSSK